MSMTSWMKITIALGFFSVYSAVASTGTMLFGPQTYSGGAQAPLASSTFPLTAADSCDGKAAFVLVVENGDTEGHRVSAATVTLNSVIVFDEADFSQRVTRLEVPVPLLAQNRLEVQIRGSGTLTVSVRKEIEAVVYGTKLLSVIRPTQTFADMIHIDDPAGTFVVTMHSGDAVGAHRVKEASLRVNGTNVATVDTRHTSVRAITALQTENSIAVDTRGAAGDVVSIAIARIVDDSVCTMHVEFIAPTSGETITSHELIASGTVSGPTDVAVSVNRFPAQMDLAHRGTPDDPFHWSALVKASRGTVTLVAEARDGGNGVGTAKQVVTFSPLPQPAIVRAAPSTGLAPLTSSFLVLPTIEGSTVPPVFDVDFDGDGVFELTGVTELPEPMAHTYANPGTYRMTLRVHDGVAVRSVVCLVTVQSFRDIDRIVQRRWQTLRSALAQQDIEAALQVFMPVAQAKYRAIFMKIRDRLPSIAAAMPLRIGSTAVTSDTAEYLVIRTENGRPAGYHFSLMRDAHGVWKATDF